MMHEATEENPLLTDEDCEKHASIFKEGGFEVYSCPAYTSAEQKTNDLDDPLVVEYLDRINRVGDMLEEIRHKQYAVEEIFLQLPRPSVRSNANNRVDFDGPKTAAAQLEAQRLHDAVERFYNELTGSIL